MSAADNSSAIDFVPGLAKVERTAMQKVEDTARGLLAANTELQRQVAFWQRESGDVLDRAEEAERALASLHNVALLDVVAERDGALGELADVSLARDAAQAALDETEEALADQHERAAAVVAAWTVEGHFPPLHRRWKQKVRGGWPALGRALDRLATEVR